MIGIKTQQKRRAAIADWSHLIKMQSPVVKDIAGAYETLRDILNENTDRLPPSDFAHSLRVVDQAHAKLRTREALEKQLINSTKQGWISKTDFKDYQEQWQSLQDLDTTLQSVQDNTGYVVSCIQDYVSVVLQFHTVKALVTSTKRALNSYLEIPRLKNSDTSPFFQRSSKLESELGEAKGLIAGYEFAIAQAILHRLAESAQELYAEVAHLPNVVHEDRIKTLEDALYQFVILIKENLIRLKKIELSADQTSRLAYLEELSRPHDTGNASQNWLALSKDLESGLEETTELYLQMLASFHRLQKYELTQTSSRIMRASEEQIALKLGCVPSNSPIISNDLETNIPYRDQVLHLVTQRLRGIHGLEVPDLLALEVRENNKPVFTSP